MNSFEWSWALAKVKVLWFGDFVFLQNFIFYFFLHGCYCDHCISRSSRSAGAMLRCWVICPKTPRSLWWSCKPVFSLTSGPLCSLHSCFRDLFHPGFLWLCYFCAHMHEVINCIEVFFCCFLFFPQREEGLYLSSGSHAVLWVYKPSICFYCVCCWGVLQH